MDGVRQLIKNVGKTYLDGSSGFPGVLYHPIPFKEYLNIPVHKLNCVEELRLILANYDFEGKKVLEIGAAAGWFAFNLAQKGAKVTAYEGDPNMASILSALKAEQNIDVDIRNEYFTGTDEQYDCCLMLNVAMWLQKQMGPEKLKDLMRSIKCHTMFYQTAHAESNGMHKMMELRDRYDVETYLEECNFTPELLKETEHDHKPRLFYKCTRNQ